MFHKRGNFYTAKSQSEISLTGFVANWSTVKGFEDMYYFDKDAEIWFPKRLDDLFYNRHFFGDIDDMCYVFFDLLVPQRNIDGIQSDEDYFELISRCYTTSLHIQGHPIDLRGKLITLEGTKYTEADVDGFFPDIDWVEVKEVKIHSIDIEKVFSGFDNFDVDFFSKTADKLWVKNYQQNFDIAADGDFVLSTRPETMDIPIDGMSDHWAEIMYGYFGWWETVLFSK